MFNFAKFLILDLPNLILMVETLFSGFGKAGPAKKNMVMTGMQGLLEAAVAQGVKLPLPEDQIMYLIGLLTDAYVTQKNTDRTFSHYGGPEK